MTTTRTIIEEIGSSTGALITQSVDYVFWFVAFLIAFFGFFGVIWAFKFAMKQIGRHAR